MPRKIKIIDKNKKKLCFKKIINETVRLNSKRKKPLDNEGLVFWALLRYFGNFDAYRERPVEICDYVAELWGKQHVKDFLSKTYINGEKLIDA